jgi:hypothetical protein
MVAIKPTAVKKWATGAGITSAVAVITYLLYLQFIGAITITGYSGDSFCAGTIERPCYAFINFTANQPVSMKIDKDLFETSPAIDSWKLYKKSGKNWVEINLSKSISLSTGTKYEWQIKAIKRSSMDNVKWSAFSGKVDPWWNATTIAQGGIVTYVGSRTVHTFKANGTFNISQAIDISALILGGGGYGGQGGSGAGGLNYTNFTLTTNCTISVGKGGTYSGSVTVLGFNGGSSSICNISVPGGGTAGFNNVAPYYNGSDGGSAGGGALKSGTTTYGGKGIPGLGNDGGGNGGFSGDKYPGGGGGGAGGPGHDASSLTHAGDGGPGINISINGTLIEYACGGGAPIYMAGGTEGKGGCSNAGDGGNAGDGKDGKNGTGSGAGGGMLGPDRGGRGGDGIVIISYLTPGGGSPPSNSCTYTAPGNFRINLSDGCNLTTPTVINGGFETYGGPGFAFINASISNASYVNLNSNGCTPTTCEVRCGPGGCVGK